MKKIRIFLLAGAASLLLTTGVAVSTAEGSSVAKSVQHTRTWVPKQTINLESCLSAGSQVDLNGRALAQAANSGHVFKKQQVVVQDLAGSGPPGVVQVLGSTPNGYTVGICSSGPLQVTPLLKSEAGQLPYSTPSTFTQMTEVGEIGFDFTVPGNSPYSSMSALFAAAKANPGSLTVALGGPIGSIGQLEFDNAVIAAGLTPSDFTILPTSGSAAALALVLGNKVAGWPSSPAGDAGIVAPYVKLNQLKILGVWANSRLKNAPNVPTMKEQKFGTLILASAITLFVPNGTPKYILQGLYNGFETASNSKFYRTTEVSFGEQTTLKLTPSATKKVMNKQVPQIREVLSAIGLG